MNIQPIVLNLAALFVSNADFQAYCTENFGLAATGYVDPPPSVLTSAKCPYVALTADAASNQEVSDSDEKSVRCLVCIDSSLDKDGCPTDTVSPLENVSGVFVSGQGSLLGTMVEKLTAIVSDEPPGALYVGASVDYDNGSQYPLQSALITFSFKTFKSF